MPTFGQLQDRISLDYLNRTDLLPEVKRAILNSIRTYEGTRFWFNETQTALAASAGQTFVSIPSDFLILDRLEVTQNSSNFKLVETSFDNIKDENIVQTQGLPVDFSYHGNRFELFPIPDSAYTVTCYYIRTLPVLSADADTNAWTTEASNLIAHDAAMDLLANVVQASSDAVQRHAIQRNAAFTELSMRNTTRIIKRLRATYF